MHQLLKLPRISLPIPIAQVHELHATETHRWQHGVHSDRYQIAALAPHIGFIMKTPEDVDAWHAFLQANNVEMKSAPRTHRDGARSFYCVGPQDVVVQMIYHPPIANS